MDIKCVCMTEKEKEKKSFQLWVVINTVCTPIGNQISVCK